MQRQFEIELARVKAKYEDAVEKVDTQSKTLSDSFRQKVKTIKEKAALFFAKTEIKLKENNDEVLKVSHMFRQWQENVHNPTVKYEAQMFSVNSKMQQNEQERETEFGLMFDVMTKLVQALEDKTSNELVQMHYGGPEPNTAPPPESMTGSYSERK